MERAVILAVAVAVIVLLSYFPTVAAAGGSTSVTTLPYVKYTVVLKNGTRVDGNYIPNSSQVASQGEAAIAYDQKTGDLYVTNLLDNISVISSTAFSLKKTLKVGGEPFDIIYDSNNGNIYASNLNQQMSVINGRSIKLTGNISTFAFSSRMAFNSKTNTIYLLNLLNLSYEKIDLSSNKLTGNISIGLYNGTYRHPVPGIAYDSTNNTVFVSNFENSTLVVLNATTGRILRNITFLAQVGGLLYNRQNNNVYAAVPLYGQVYIINASNYGIVGNMTTGAYPSSISVAPQADYIFVTDELSGTLSVYNLSTHKLLETLNLSSGSTGACYVSETGYLYVVNSGKGTMSVIYVNQPAQVNQNSNGLNIIYLIIPVAAIIVAGAMITYLRRKRK